ncbi:MAG: adaptor protein MecA [Lachnospiraceae bacterium]|nr:adaptor protein MecA [Lachnospiraceae bacterium]
MKIEKVNDNQIRCTLTKEDLACRSLKISELAYGTQKAKDLFRDMMQQASFEFGFEAEDIPLMIEAIPFSEYVVLIITKVEDPEELDTRFSKFAPSNEEEDEDFEEEEADTVYDEAEDHTQEVLNLFKRIKDSCDEVLSHAEAQGGTMAAPTPEVPKAPDANAVKSSVKGLMQAFIFVSISDIIDIAHLINDRFTAPSSVYKNESTGEYLLLVKQGDYSVEEFAKVCNLLSEYAVLFRAMNNAESYMEEHFSPVCIGNALNTLSQI